MAGPSTVLLVDDDFVVLGLFGMFFTRLGYRVVTAGGGVAAAALALSDRPDAVVSDVQMPSGDGWSLLRQIRCSFLLHDTPFCFLSHHPRQSHWLSEAGRGPDRYVPKEARLDTAREALVAALAPAEATAAAIASATAPVDLDVQRVGPVAVLRLAARSGKRGRIVFCAGGATRADVRFDREFVVHATVNAPAPAEGLEALTAIACRSWTSGRFEPGDSLEDSPPLGPTLGLLTSACARGQALWARICEQGPADLRVDDGALAAFRCDAYEEGLAADAFLAGTPIDRICGEWSWPRERMEYVLFSLLRSGAIHFDPPHRLVAPAASSSVRVDEPVEPGEPVELVEIDSADVEIEQLSEADLLGEPDPPTAWLPPLGTLEPATAGDDPAPDLRAERPARSWITDGEPLFDPVPVSLAPLIPPPDSVASPLGELVRPASSPEGGTTPSLRWTLVAIGGLAVLGALVIVGLLTTNRLADVASAGPSAGGRSAGPAEAYHPTRLPDKETPATASALAEAAAASITAAPPPPAEPVASAGAAPAPRSAEVGAASKRDPAAARAHLAEGNRLYLVGSKRPAVASYRLAVRADPKLAEAHRALALAYASLGEHDAARAALTRYVRLSGDFRGAAEVESALRDRE